MAESPLVQPGELEEYMHRTLALASALSAIRVASGWLRDATEVEGPWPEPVPEALWAWAVELAAMAYDNPTSLSTRTVGAEVDVMVLARRAEILEAARKRYGTGRGPRFSFPPASVYPDYWPARIGWHG